MSVCHILTLLQERSAAELLEQQTKTAAELLLIQQKEASQMKKHKERESDLLRMEQVLANFATAEVINSM